MFKTNHDSFFEKKNINDISINDKRIKLSLGNDILLARHLGLKKTREYLVLSLTALYCLNTAKSYFIKPLILPLQSQAELFYHDKTRFYLFRILNTARKMSCNATHIIY